MYWKGFIYRNELVKCWLFPGRRNSRPICHIQLVYQVYTLLLEMKHKWKLHMFLKKKKLETRSQTGVIFIKTPTWPEGRCKRSSCLDLGSIRIKRHDGVAATLLTIVCQIYQNTRVSGTGWKCISVKCGPASWGQLDSNRVWLKWFFYIYQRFE